MTNKKDTRPWTKVPGRLLDINKKILALSSVIENEIDQYLDLEHTYSVSLDNYYKLLTLVHVVCLESEKIAEKSRITFGDMVPAKKNKSLRRRNDE